MPVYMLDTDIASYVIKRSHSAVIERLKSVPVRNVCISAITRSELLYGVEVSPRPEQDGRAVEAFLRVVATFDYPSGAAAHYGAIRAALRKAGTMIGANDLFIAAHARSAGLVLVTNNPREFGRIADLKIENWTELPG